MLLLLMSCLVLIIADNSEIRTLIILVTFIEKAICAECLENRPYLVTRSHEAIESEVLFQPK